MPDVLRLVGDRRSGEAELDSIGVGFTELVDYLGPAAAGLFDVMNLIDDDGIK